MKSETTMHFLCDDTFWTGHSIFVCNTLFKSQMNLLSNGMPFIEIRRVEQKVRWTKLEVEKIGVNASRNWVSQGYGHNNFKN